MALRTRGYLWQVESLGACDRPWKEVQAPDPTFRMRYSREEKLQACINASLKDLSNLHSKLGLGAEAHWLESRIPTKCQIIEITIELGN